MRDYSDIINVVYKKSKTRAHMKISDRAAQFAPFSALSGHDAAIAETARLTQKKVELCEEEIENLNKAVFEILNSNEDMPKITVEYFVPDEKKQGGRYEVFSGRIRLVECEERKLVFKDGTEILMDNVLKITKEKL